MPDGSSFPENNEQHRSPKEVTSSFIKSCKDVGIHMSGEVGKHMIGHAAMFGGVLLGAKLTGTELDPAALKAYFIASTAGGVVGRMIMNRTINRK
jgi:hypothetical protein